MWWYWALMMRNVWDDVLLRNITPIYVIVTYIDWHLYSIYVISLHLVKIWGWWLFCNLLFQKHVVHTKLYFYVYISLGKHLDAPLFFGGVRVVHLSSFLCCVFWFCLVSFCVMCPVLPLSLDCPFFIDPSVFSSA